MEFSVSIDKMVSLIKEKIVLWNRSQSSFQIFPANGSQLIPRRRRSAAGQQVTGAAFA